MTGGARRIWVDLANSPQVLFFLPLLRHWADLGHQVTVTSRPYAQTVALCDRAGLEHTPIGIHGGKSLWKIGGALLQRSAALRTWASDWQFDLAVSHNSYSQILAARGLGLRVATSMDYEYQKANHLAFRLAHRIVLPRCFPEPMARRFGAGSRVRRYDGIKEQVYLAGFTPDPAFRRTSGLPEDQVLVVLRPAADWALYHRFENPLASRLLEHLLAQDGLHIVFLPRVESQAQAIRALQQPRIHLPGQALDGPSLLASADAVFSAGGTMAREAAVLGTPAYSLFRGRSPAVDQLLVQQDRLTILRTQEEVDALRIEPCRARRDLLQAAPRLVDQVATLLLD